jgi:hypothetical protein
MYRKTGRALEWLAVGILVSVYQCMSAILILRHGFQVVERGLDIVSVAPWMAGR